MVRVNRQSIRNSSGNGNDNPVTSAIKTFQSLQYTRKLSLLVFIVCVFTSVSVIFITGNGQLGYMYTYYDEGTSSKDFLNNFSANKNHQQQHNNNSNSDSDHIRQKALENAKKQTEKWRQNNNADEVELNSIIDQFQQEIAQLEKEQKTKQQEEEVKEKEVNQNYYLYYQDDIDTSSTIIGLPSLSNTMKYSDPIIFKRFVGSLRATGYGGNIIIGIDTTSSNESVTNEILSYLQSQNVIIKILKPMECTFEFAKKNQKCYHPYSHIKREWSYFPLARDWLTSCDTCTGSVVLTSVKDTIFQRNPFGKGMPIVQRLHLYELHPTVSAVDISGAGVLLKACENIDLDKIDINLKTVDDLKLSDPKRLRILSSGIALGTRDDVIDYLGAIHSVMREWMHRSQCHFEHSSSDDGMAIVNYLRLQNRLPYRTRIIPHRTGIVNNVGYEGRNAYEAHVYLWEFKGLTEEDAGKIPYEGGEDGEKGWIDGEYMLTDKDGNFIDVFFQKSAVIYEYGAFGPPFTTWFDKKLNLTSSSSGTSTSSTLTDESGTMEGNDGSGVENDDEMETRDDDKFNFKEDINKKQHTQDEKDHKDDYYIKENEEGSDSFNNTTLAVNVRKVKNATEVAEEKQQTEALLNTTKKEDEKEQAIYYKNRLSDDTNTTDSTGIEDEGTEESDEIEEKVPQVVPVEETLVVDVVEVEDEDEDEDEKKDTSANDDNNNNNETEDEDSEKNSTTLSKNEKGKGRKIKRKDEQ